MKSKNEDNALIKIAAETIEGNFHITKHTIGAAVQFRSGAVFSSINIRGCDYSVCAERIAIVYGYGNGERGLKTLVSVLHSFDGDSKIITPCGNCRQFLIDYEPNSYVIMPIDGGMGKVMARDLLINPYVSNFEPVEKLIKKYDEK